MAKVRNNPILQKVTGKFGDVVVLRDTVHGLVMANVPAKQESFHPVQLQLQDRFRSGVHYANCQTAKEETRALYKTGICKKLNSAYQVALTDYLNAPVIRKIAVHDYQANAVTEVLIYAKDDFKVASVSVMIINAAGEEIEHGEAILAKSLRDVWIYTITSYGFSLRGVSITATAKDLPGNAAIRTLTFDV